MGMYTEINVCFDLTKGTPKNVVQKAHQRMLLMFYIIL